MRTGPRVVGIGGSSGGAAALRLLLQRFRHFGATLVVALSPAAEDAALSEVLGKSTPFKVSVVTRTVPLEPGHLYLVPERTDAVVVGETLVVAPQPVLTTRAVDALFNSLAREYGDEAIGVALSGDGRDGATGLMSIHTAGGLTLAQSPSSAEHEETPRICAPHARFVGDPQRLGDLLNDAFGLSKRRG